MRGLLAALCLCLCVSAGADETAQEIEHLIQFVATSGCDFERNDGVHDPQGAADHLRLKLSNGGRYVKTAENFIDRLASKSSWTGREYHAICEGERIKSSDWLYGALADYRQSTPQP
jgi:hypothetical protein